jgi:DNA-directed RNA polymerase subunit beta
MFFNPQKYDFSRVGRLKLNTKLGLNTPLDERILHPQDFYEVIKYLLKLKKNPANVDDIDHLGNRRVRSVGELLENQFRIGLVRMERAIKEKMSVYQEMATAMPHDLINAKPVMAAIREFFGSSQLSQFMDQTNPLSEVTHKRASRHSDQAVSRASARASKCATSPDALRPYLPDRDAGRPEHRPHLVALVLRADQRLRLHRVAVPQSGRRPGRRLRPHHERRRPHEVQGRRRRSRPMKSSAPAADRRRRASSSSPTASISPRGKRTATSSRRPTSSSTRSSASSRNASTRVQAGEFILAHRDKIDYVDVSPKQLVSVAASLIPFLENDDANRALMGSNMQRQAGAAPPGAVAVCRHRHGIHHGARLGRRRGGAPLRLGRLRRLEAHRRSC